MPKQTMVHFKCNFVWRADIPGQTPFTRMLPSCSDCSAESTVAMQKKYHRHIILIHSMNGSGQNKSLQSATAVQDIHSHLLGIAP